MDANSVDLFMATNADKLPQDALPMLRERLIMADAEEFGRVLQVQLRNPVVALVLSTSFGPLGIDRFYIGHYVQGLVKLLTCGGCIVFTIADWFRIMSVTRNANLDDIDDCLDVL